MTRRSYHLAIFLLLSAVCGVLVAGIVLPGALVVALTAKTAADQSAKLPAQIKTAAPAGRTEIQYADGSHLAWLYDLNRVPVGLADIAPVMRQAQLAIENHRFYQQGPLDLQGLTRSAIGNATTGGEAGGGSGITQQYVKMLRIEQALLSGDPKGIAAAQERTMTRKVQELRYALSVDKNLTKDQIFTVYLNLAYYGDGTYGVEAAAQHYFSTHASKLTLPQAALLAGIVKSPTEYNPRTHPAAAQQRRNTVLDRMATTGQITRDQATAARHAPLGLHPGGPVTSGCQASAAPFLCEAALRELLYDPALGATRDQRRATIHRGGLTVRTTIQPATQAAAQRAVAATIAPTDPAIGLVSIVQPGTGHVLAMAQSRPTMSATTGGAWYNYPLPTNRGGAEGYQAGSTFKALTLAAALEHGIDPSRRYNAPAALTLDGRTYQSCSGPFTFTGHHVVTNLANRSFGDIDLAKATQDSVNTYYLQLAQDVGLCDIARMGDRLGVQRADGKPLAGTADQVATLTLGPIEVAPLSIANAYATLAAHGLRCDTTFIASTSRNGRTTGHTPHCEQVLDADIADRVTAVLRTVMTEGSGRTTALPDTPDQAGKTGTTDDNQTVWFAGYTPSRAGAAMIAIDKRHPWWETRWRKTLKGIRLPDSGTWLEGTGGGDAGRHLWRPAMLASTQEVGQ